MSSSAPSETKRAEPLAQARPAFNWIELLAIPIASSIMETQPIVLVMLLAATFFVGENATPLLDAASITLLLLGLQWWAMLIQYFIQRGMNEEWAKFFHPLGLCVAFAIMIATHLAFLNNIPALVIAFGLVVWFWRRGMKLSRIGSSDEYLFTSFKVGFIVLLVVVLFAAIYFSPVTPFEPPYTALHNTVGIGLTIYFLSGVISLSLTRISIIRRENAYRTPGSSLADPTRLWLVVLILLWVAISALALALEVFSFGSVLTVMLWPWNALGILVNWIGLLINSLVRLIAPFFPHFVSPPPLPHSTTHPPTPNSSGQPTQPLPLAVLMLLHLMLLFILLGILLLVIRAILRKWRVAADDDSEEEVRESLSRQVILKSRREEQQRRRSKESDIAPLEPLAPDSARAHYRELLQALATQSTNLARRPEETPHEYEARLLTLMQKASPAETQQDDLPPDPQLLDELTQAYALERYGGKPSSLPHAAQLPVWVLHFIKRLKR